MRLGARQFGHRNGKLVYCAKLLQRTARGFAHLSPASPDSAQEIATEEFTLRPGSSVVERGPEKAGVGGSIPSLATII